METSVEGLTTWQDMGGAVSQTVKSLPVDGAYTVTQLAPDGSYSLSLYQNGRLASVTRYASNSVQIGKITYGYDAHGRQNTVTDARNGTTTFTFNNADQVVTITTPPPGTGASAQTTVTFYDKTLRATNVVYPDGTSVASAYSLRGELLRTSGSRTYPVGYAYDAQGRLKQMTNWSSFSALTGARVTTWNYDTQRGWLTNKVYPDGLGPKYSYTAAGRLSTRLWARGTNTTYSYNNFGELASVDYSDATPDLAYRYNRRGQQETVTQGTNSWKLFYTTAGAPLADAWTGGLLNGWAVTNNYDAYLRRTNAAVRNGGTTLATNGYSYDLAGRLRTARAGSAVATYDYLANSPLVGQIQFNDGANTRMTTTKDYDYLNRLTQISSVGATGSIPSQFGYQYNDANQRTRVTLADGSYWIYDYDTLGQVISGKRYWSDGTPVAGQQFEYGFDDHWQPHQHPGRRRRPRRGPADGLLHGQHAEPDHQP